MSIQAVSWAIETPCPTPSSKLVLICLANYADKNGEAFPGQSRLSKDAGFSVRTVQRLLVELCDSGLIDRVHRQRKDGSRTSDLYRLNTKATNCHVGKSKATSETVQGDISGSSNMTPMSGVYEPSVEPSVKPPLLCSKDKKSDFDLFWKAYPNKVSKARARTAYDKAIKKTDLETLLAGLTLYINKNDYREWQHPATWLNGECWKDQPASPILTPTRATLSQSLMNDALAQDEPDDIWGGKFSDEARLIEGKANE